jgi:hypothetical protein
MPAPTPLDAVRAAIEGMGGTIAIAQALVMGGRQVDLEGLDRDGAALCTAVMMLERQDGRLLIPALEALVRQLHDLTEAIPAP